MKWWEETWNPVIGCSPASPGCDNCYAARNARVRAANPVTPQYAGLVGVDGKWTGETRFVQEQLLKPLGWRRGKRIFVCSMGDLFHPSVPFEWVDKVFGIMARCPQHAFIVLTKRPERMREYLTGLRDDPEQAWRFEQQWQTAPNPYHRYAMLFRRGGALPNLWLGVTMESPQYYWRYEYLLITPAAKRIVSFEPLLAEMDIGRPHPDWVICGGETGAGARPMHPDWARSLRDQCKGTGVPFFFKQGGGWKGITAFNGRLLDGREHNDIPEVSHG